MCVSVCLLNVACVLCPLQCCQGFSAKDALGSSGPTGNRELQSEDVINARKLESRYIVVTRVHHTRIFVLFFLVFGWAGVAIRCCILCFVVVAVKAPEMFRLRRLDSPDRGVQHARYTAGRSFFEPEHNLGSWVDMRCRFTR